MKIIKDTDVKGKRVLLRVDFNVPLQDGKIDANEDWRIKAALPTIEYLLKNQAKVIIISHLDERTSLKLAADYLTGLLKKEVKFVGDCIGEKARMEADKMESGEILMLENLRLHPEEEANDENFAKQLASLGDIYINDAFSVSHRRHASIVSIPKFLPSFAGFLLEKETEALENVLKNPKRPLIAIIGGAKISTKIKLLKKFLGFADRILLGGALVNTVLQAKGYAVGRSLTEAEMIAEVKEINFTNTKLHIPVDVVASMSLDRGATRIAGVGGIKEEEKILDIGPETIEMFGRIIREAKTVLWSGPLGLAEVEPFSKGTREIAEAIIKSRAYSVVGGGDTVAILRKIGLAGGFGYLSTGGGAMLEFLAEGTLPGLKALETPAQI